MTALVVDAGGAVRASAAALLGAGDVRPFSGQESVVFVIAAVEAGVGAVVGGQGVEAKGSYPRRRRSDAGALVRPAVAGKPVFLVVDLVSGRLSRWGCCILVWKSAGGQAVWAAVSHVSGQKVVGRAVRCVGEAVAASGRLFGGVCAAGVADGVA